MLPVVLVELAMNTRSLAHSGPAIEAVGRQRRLMGGADRRRWPVVDGEDGWAVSGHPRWEEEEE